MIVVIAGNNLEAAEKEFQSIKAEWLKTNNQLNYESHDVADRTLAELLQIVSSQSLLDEQRLVVVRGLSRNPQAIEFVESMEDSPGLLLLILEQGNTLKPSLAKPLKSKSDFRQFSQIKGGQLASWVKQEADHHGVKIEPQAVDKLIEYVDENQMMLAQEIAKLSVYPVITSSLVDELVDPLPRAKSFALIDLAFAGKSQEAISTYHDLRAQKQEPQKLLGLITWQVQVIVFAGLFPEASSQQLTQAGIRDYPYKKSKAIVAKRGLIAVKRILEDLIQAEREVKNGGNPDAAIELFLLSLGQS